MNTWILALKAGPTRPNAPKAAVKAGQKLRAIIESIKRDKPTLFENVIASVGPKFSVMLAYGRESNPKKVFELAESIQAVAEARRNKKERQWGLAGVVTRGEVTVINVLGTSWNFEGRAAVAAARVLAKLDLGVLAVEKDGWTDAMLPSLGDPKTIAGKREGEEFAIRIHSRISFPASFEAGEKPQQYFLDDEDADAKPENNASPQEERVWRRLHIDAFPSVGGAPPLIRERYELVTTSDHLELVLPLSLSIDHSTVETASLKVVEPVDVFDETKVCEANLIPPRDNGGFFGVRVKLGKHADDHHRMIEIYYRPELDDERISIQLPSNQDFGVTRARVVLWGDREQLNRNVTAFSIGTGDNGHTRHPIIAERTQLNEDPYAMLFDINLFDGHYDHKISWPATQGSE